ncbi:MAG: hypothetical protein QOJ02_3183 [Acidobacteriota bacterium]|nr:hypothetical protein [Acidobacteriota bacterium]
MREPDVAADDAPATDDGLAAQDGCARINHNVILNRRVSLGVAHQTPRRIFVERERAERDALVDFDIVADDGCAADDYSRAVIYKEARADLRARMNVYPCAVMRVLGHDAWYQGHAHRVQLVREAIDHHGVDARIAEDDLVQAGRRRVALVSSLNVSRQQLAQARQLGQESCGAIACFRFRHVARLADLVAVPDGALDLLRQDFVKPGHARFDVNIQTLTRQPLRADVARKEQLMDGDEHANNLGVRRQRLAIKMVNLDPVSRV